MELKPTYTKEEINEMVAWFTARLDRLPAELQLNSSTHISQLRPTVERLLDLAQCQRENATFGTQIHLLGEIRDCLEAQDMG